MDTKYIKVATVGEFVQRSIKSVRVLGKPVAIIKDSDGMFRAMEAGCKHQNADITRGAVKDGIATCPWHGWQYDLRTGECVSGGTAPLRPYGCKVEGENILITLQPQETGSVSESSFVPFE